MGIDIVVTGVLKLEITVQPLDESEEPTVNTVSCQSIVPNIILGGIVPSWVFTIYMLNFSVGTKAYLHIMSFLHIDMTQVVEILY